MQREANQQVLDVEQKSATQLEELKNTIAELTSHVSSLKNEADEQQDQIGELLGANDSLTRHLKNTESDLIKSQEQSNAQHTLIDNLRGDKGLLETRVTQLLEGHEKLNAQLLAQQQLHEKIVSDLHQQQQEELKAQTLSHEQAVSCLRRSLEDEHSLLQQAWQTERVGLIDQQDAQLNIIKTAELQHQQQTHTIEQLRIQVEALNTRLDEGTHREQQLEQFNSDKENRLLTAADSLQEINDEMRLLQLDLSDRNARLAVLEPLIEHLGVPGKNDD